MSADQPTGLDLCRLALIAQKEAARRRGAGAQRKPSTKRPATALHGTGREPLGLGGAVARLVIERGWEKPKGGGEVIGRWKDIVTPEVAAHLQPAAFHPDSGRLDLVPDNPSWAFQAQLISAQLIEQVNKAVGSQTVQKIRVLPVGSRIRPTHTQDSPADEPVEVAARAPLRTSPIGARGREQVRAALQTSPAPVIPGRLRTREDGAAGYQATRALVKSTPAKAPPDREPARTREDGSAHYQEVRALVGSTTPAPGTLPRTMRTPNSGSTEYQQTRRALLEGKSRIRRPK